MYIESKTINGRKYYYLVKDIRLGKQKKKFRTYLGKGDKSQKELASIKQEKADILLNKIHAYIKTKDYFYSLLSVETIKKLDQIKQDYKTQLARLYNKDDYYEWFITKFTYNSNAIEGSTLTEKETGLILFDGIVPKGKSLREIHESESHKKAFDFVLEYKKDIDLAFILELNKIILSNILPNDAGKIRKLQVYIRGANFVPPPAKEVRRRLNALLKWYDKNKRKYHPVIVASYVHTEFEEIHPFIDGNGRVGRLLLNFILMKKRLPPIDIKASRRLDYYESLDKAHQGNLRDFVKLVVNYLFEK